ncbi:hypothetical protein [Mesorhizobium metallidurans]|uniref:hypothetical protein n=1 Tax=Mesorhizobium metallidurans TaxID=489722 RepID=UPI0012FB2675|nr:hypothetical protein [Mesorhizobium metallidurans]
MAKRESCAFKDVALNAAKVAMPPIFTRFRSRGVVLMSGDSIERGAPSEISDDGHRGQHENELPLNSRVIDFE